MLSLRDLRPAASWLVFAALLVPFATQAQTSPCPGGGPVVDSPAGQICGFTSEVLIQGAEPVSASAFLGIPYAQPPIGELRWQSPQPLSSLPEKPYLATRFGSECVQIPFGDTKPAGDENCLFLNVWTPSGATPDTKYPVMVFIHGGAFVFGSGGAGPVPDAPGFSGGQGSSDLFDGTYLATTHKVIIVTLNYRLGVFGFFSLEKGLTGNNFGLQDQVLALKWVQQNIASFGGDPSKVTIFGQSAGAMSVGLLTLSSENSNLFHAAIMESNPMGIPYKTTAQANAVGKLLSRMMGCETPEERARCMAKKTAEELVKSAHSPGFTILALGLPFHIKIADLVTWAPAIDGTLLNNHQPAAHGASLPIPMLLGSNSAEGILFESAEQVLPYDMQIAALVGKDKVEMVKSAYPCKELYCSSVAAQVFTDYIFSCANRHLAIQAAGASHPKPVYAYEFTQKPSFNLLTSLPACNGKDCHGAELPFVFNTFELKDVGVTTNEELLSQGMGGYWTAFGTHQNPNGGGLPDWPLFSGEKKYMNLVQKPYAVTDPFATAAHCTDLWDVIGYPAPGMGKALQNLLQSAPR